MGQHTQEDFLLLVRPLPRSQRRAEPTLAPREHALRLPKVAVQTARAALPAAPEVALHLPAITGLGPTPTAVAAVQGEQGRADALLLPAPLVLVLSVVAAVPPQRV